MRVPRERKTKTQYPYATPKQAQLWYMLHAAFEAEPLENGMDHPAEEIIAEALRHPEDRQVLECLENLSLDAEHPSFAERAYYRHVNKHS